MLLLQCDGDELAAIQMPGLFTGDDVTEDAVEADAEFVADVMKLPCRIMAACICITEPFRNSMLTMMMYTRTTLAALTTGC